MAGDSPEVTDGVSAGATMSNESDAAEDVLADRVPPELSATSALSAKVFSSVDDTSPANQAHSVNTCGPSRAGSDQDAGVALRGDGAAPATRLPADDWPAGGAERVPGGGPGPAAAGFGGAANASAQLGATSTVDAETGWVTGWVFAEDPDDDTVSYSGTGPTRKGDVIVYEDASFLYKPTLAARRLAATMGGDQDTFTIKVRDGRGRGRTIPVTVDVLPCLAARTSVDRAGNTLILG